MEALTRPRGARSGISILEVIVVVAVVGVLAGLAATLLPRQGIAVGQAERLLSAALQSGRFEAIRSNQNVVVRLGEGATEVTIRFAGAANTMQRVALDPQGGRVVIKFPEVEELEFNARGVAVVPVPRTLTLGVVGQERYDVDLEVSAHGVVTRQ